MIFNINQQLLKDCHQVLDLPVSRVLLMNNRNFPWVILVPRIEEAVELIDLDDITYDAVTGEIKQVGKIMQEIFQPYKLNIAALGNMVRQLHIHIIARFENDPAWPNPVWGSKSEAYFEEESQKLVELVKQKLDIITFPRHLP
jgi:diadenosine tetraphosphate (Ap4A) HIT family hydrolase